MVSPLSAVKQKRLLWATTVVALLAPVAAVGARWRDGVKAAEQVRAGERVLDAPMDEAPTPEQLEAGRAEALFGRAVSLDPGDARTRRARALWAVARARSFAPIASSHSRSHGSGSAGICSAARVRSCSIRWACPSSCATVASLSSALPSGERRR